MLRQRKLRDRLVAMAAPPILMSAAAAIAVVVLADSSDGSRIGLIALAATIVVGVASFFVGWTILGSVNSLAIAADGLAEAQLRIANGDMEAAELPSIDHAGPADELGRVAEAVDAISSSAVEMAESQRESIRKGLATIVINLARRNQSLLDRQVEYLDKLEQSEEDPDRLGELFRVDHLATRMRRNAESLLVLAGSDTVKRKGASVTMSDVLRVAIGEVENYQHIELGVIEEGEVPASVAVDLAHMTAELMENATQFSPPSTTVEVAAVVDRPTESFRITVADRGMGLGDRLELANETLADPPELGLGMGRSLGFMVVGRLARRLGAEVKLRANDGGGTVAEVFIPLSLFQLDQPEPKPTPRPNPAPKPAPVAEPRADVAPVPAPTEQPAPQPQPQPQQPTIERQGAASTALEKLLGIAPKAPASPSPPPTAKAEPMPFTAEDAATAGLPDQLQAPTFDSLGPVADESSLPAPADDPTWSSLTVASGPTADLPTATPPPAAKPDQFDEEAAWTPPPMPPASHRSTEPAWKPPPLPAPNPVDESWAPPTAPPPSRFDEAVPSGDAFESGVASLLGPAGSTQAESAETGWPDTSPSAQEPQGGLQKRERGASNVPIGQGRPVAAPSRSPEEVRAMLSRYRDGRKSGGKRGPDDETQNPYDEKDGER